MRYGVAPDHPSIKFIADALEKTLDNPNIHLYANVEFGKDIALEDLLHRYDAVLFATGAVEDRPLRGVPGADLDGVYGAAKFVEWYDGYPTSNREWPLEAKEVAVIGGGNVAMDVARELLRDPDYLRAHTDIPDDVYEGLQKIKPKPCIYLFVVELPKQNSLFKNCAKWKSYPECKLLLMRMILNLTMRLLK